MTAKKRALVYGFFGFFIVLIDRLVKYWALSSCANRCTINDYLSFEVVFNRGVSWGWFHSPNEAVFGLVSSIIVLIMIVLAWNTVRQFERGHLIVGHVMVLAGAVSNTLDRLLYRGVIDFIELSYGGWSWPVFNVADVCIVFGVGLMAVEYYRR